MAEAATKCPSWTLRSAPELWVAINPDGPIAPGSLWRAFGDSVDLQMFDDGDLPKQNHLHAWCSSIFAIRKGQRLREPVFAFHMERT